MKNRSTLSDSPRQKLLSAVSHDLRSPLASIQIILQGLLSGNRGSLSPDQTQDLAVIQNQVYRLLLLIGNLLVASDLQKNNPPLVGQPFDLADVVHDAAHQLASTAKSKHLTLTVDSPPSINVIGHADLLLHVIMNLLSNAIKFTPKGDIGLTVTVGKNEALVEVWDSGPGMSAEVLQKTKRFESSDDDSEFKKGFGLGLYIAQTILASHHTTLRLEPRVGGGSRFSFALPMASNGFENA